MASGVERPLKIAFVGTSCTGKSTLFEHYRDKFTEDHSARFVSEAAREYFENHPEVTDRFGVKAQGDIQYMAWEREAFCYERNPKLVFCDRSVLDAPAYVRTTGDLEGSELLMRIARPWIKTYSHILLCDPEGVNYKADNIRTEDVATRNKIHQAFLDIFAENRVSYQLLSGTVEQRIRAIDRLVTL